MTRLPRKPLDVPLKFIAYLVRDYCKRTTKQRRQLVIPVLYKSQLIGEHRLDFMGEDVVVVELKSVERFDPIFEAQILTYLRLSGKRRGLLINFNSRRLKDGVKRFIL